jgi:2-enoate reductase
MRFLVETVTKTLRATRPLSPDFIVGIRLSAAEHISGGIPYEETKVVVKKMADLGVDYIHLSDGSHQAYKWAFPEEDGTMLEEADGFKKAIDITVITPSIHSPDTAEEAIREGKTDMVSLGRPLLADPEWANKVKEGRVEEIRRCTRDNFCLLRFRDCLPLRCSHNPDTGREKYMTQYQRPTGLKGDKILPVLMQKGKN